MLNHGFKQSLHDYSLFIKGSGLSFVALLVCVDDIIVTGANTSVTEAAKGVLKEAFKHKDLFKLKCFLGLEIAHSSKGITLSQRAYTLSLLADTGFTDCKPANLPMDPNLKLSSEEGIPLQDNGQYRRLVGGCFT